MFFNLNTMVSMRDATRRFRVHDYVIETWMEEGVFPECTWFNRRRYWNSDDINALIAGCPVNLVPEAASSIKRFSRRPVALYLVASAIVLLATVITR